MTRGLPGGITIVRVLVLTCLAGCTSAPPAVRPAPATATTVTSAPVQGAHAPISGRPLGPGSGIRLLISGYGSADPAPAVLDVDTGASTPITGLPDPDPKITVSSSVQGRHTLIHVGGPAVDQGRVYLLEGSTARKLATGWNAFPAFDDSGFWVTDRPVYGGPCTVRKQTESGKVLRRARWSYCGALPFYDTPYGLQGMYRGKSILLAHDSLRKIATYPRVLATTPGEWLVERPDKGLALVVPGTGKERPISRPTGADEVKDGAASADGRHIAVPFLASGPGVPEYLDVWVLDVQTRQWTRLPSMPVPVDVKTRRMRWTPDGRLVLAGAFVTTTNAYALDGDYAGMVGVWRPGDQALSVKRLPVPWQTNLEIM
ncbi:hypothetical protein J5X84_15345 [Streptosporangiaceae bacterium NEAU-GS5]|nr:hypothetical protein [Streptosporangiaceae bacterium NEAU-GS5]